MRSVYKAQVIPMHNSGPAKEIIRSVGAEAEGIAFMAPKAVHRAVKMQGVPLKAALILKQEMLARGGEVALSRQVMNLACEQTDVLIMGTLSQFNSLLAKLAQQPFGLPQLAREAAYALTQWESPDITAWQIRGTRLALGEKTLIMGILNITPDSFSDGGLYQDIPSALARAREMAAEGADIIDIGAESTRPGHQPLSAAEEKQRLLPVLAELLAAVDVPISVDTSKSEVAGAALQMGAHIINDVWGLKHDPGVAAACAEYGAGLILMHNEFQRDYGELLADIIDSLRESMAQAVELGLSREQLAVDPGFGFAKDTDQNLEVLQRLGELKVLGQPLLVGPSRKSMIGNTLKLPVQERLEGTAAVVALSVAAGADIVRVHDIQAMQRVARMTDAVVRR